MSCGRKNALFGKSRSSPRKLLAKLTEESRSSWRIQFVVYRINMSTIDPTHKYMMTNRKLNHEINDELNYELHPDLELKPENRVLKSRKKPGHKGIASGRGGASP